MTKRNFLFSDNFTDWTDSRLKSDFKETVQTEEIIKTRENKDFFLTKRSSHFSGKFTGWTDSRLKSDCKHIVQTGELQKTQKNRPISFHLYLEK